MSCLFVILITQTVSPDFEEYGFIYDNIILEETIGEALTNFRFEPVFTISFFYLSKIFEFPITFLFIAFIALIAKYFIFQKFYKYSLLAWISYVIIFLPHLESSQLRTAVAVTFLIYVISTHKPKKYYFFETIAAASFHILGVIIIFNRFIKNIIFGFLFVLIGLLFFKILITLLTSYIPFLLNYIQDDAEVQASFINSNVIVQAIIVCCSIFHWKFLSYSQKKGAFLLLIGLLIYIVLFEYPGISQRIREISLLGTLPLIFSSRLKIKFPVLVIYLMFFVLFVYNSYFLFSRLQSTI
jgi:hypothetical protein